MRVHRKEGRTKMSSLSHFTENQTVLEIIFRYISAKTSAQVHNNLHIISQGIEKNAQVLKKLYPGWVMRVYHDVSPSDAPTTAQLNQLTDQYKDILDTCYVGDLPHYGNMLGKHGHPSDSL
jgi:hypothetical protein